MRTRRIVAVLVLALIAVAAMVLPQPRAHLEITLSQASLLLDAGPLRVRALVSTGMPQSATPVLSIGGITQ